MAPAPEPPNRASIGRLIRPFLEFARLEASSGLVLMACALAAMAWANSPWAPDYFALWQRTLRLGPADGPGPAATLGHWINGGLMTVFFFQVGLEIKRELVSGELRGFRKAALPMAGALGGMVVPALIYWAFNAGGAALGGWAIPMATDIAFSLGVLALLGSRVTLGMKIFLTALAIVDDLGAVFVIAVFFTGGLSWIWLGASVAAVTAAWGFGRLGGRSPIVFVLLGGVACAFMHNSGVHATIAGVLLAFAVPAGPETEPPLTRWAHNLHPWVSFLIMPIFALANAGVTIGADLMRTATDPIALGIVAGLVVGKPLGIALGARLAVALGMAELPTGTSWRHVVGLGILGGIGFTMSLFIAELAFADEERQHLARAAILTASVTAGVLGWLWLRRSPPRPAARPAGHPDPAKNPA